MLLSTRNQCLNSQNVIHFLLVQIQSLNRVALLEISSLSPQPKKWAMCNTAMISYGKRLHDTPIFDAIIQQSCNKKAETILLTSKMGITYHNTQIFLYACKIHCDFSGWISKSFNWKSIDFFVKLCLFLLLNESRYPKE